MLGPAPSRRCPHAAGPESGCRADGRPASSQQHSAPLLRIAASEEPQRRFAFPSPWRNFDPVRRAALQDSRTALPLESLRAAALSSSYSLGSFTELSHAQPGIWQSDGRTPRPRATWNVRSLISVPYREPCLVTDSSPADCLGTSGLQRPGIVSTHHRRSSASLTPGCLAPADLYWLMY